MIKNFYLAIILCLIPMPLYAYIGPGMGGGVLAAVIGIVSSIFLALMAVIYYPIKRKFRKQNKNNKIKDDLEEEEGEPSQ